MSANTDIVRRFAAEFLGRADLGVADETIDEAVVVHTGLSPAEPIRGTRGLQAGARRLC